ncbi:AraC family transcriptional regulator [Macellibacteroides fermentans]|uniref:AraC-type DNA-binding protein n=1 Tax=Parabacteroides chartae TaxID=1037355 RepID=A0A1T5ADQ2_9BACT|nr:AraC family transcriptional regulator [Parabacteroides chartae]MBP8893313.1 helix-turn-helix domain-containing protein [Saprospiraceae bacterium]OCW94774.1 AraC family transcriptional regulator [Macellibacteroides sp. HH-ZS]SKB32939.1 AraC-type DNA-binding protein [Parabacteroides chartae]
MKDIQKEITPISMDDLFIVLDHPSAKFDYPVHYHSDYEINLVIDSCGKRIVGDSIEYFDSLDLIMIGPNLPHAWNGEIVEGNHVITIQFSDKLLDFPILEKRLFSQIKQLLLESQRGIVFSAQTQQFIKEKILRLTKMQGFHTVLEFLSILHELSIADRRILVSNQYDTKDTIRASKSRRIAKVCEFIENNFEEPIKLKDAADLVNMSESAFSHFFKKKTNNNFIDYVTNLRIARACQMLTETTHTVAEICYSCGFNNQSNFIRIFKNKKGSSPNKYRTTIQQMLIKY